ncbi:energy transducer TonB [Sphingopyxis macrogoltabida]|uniref:TonB C-terminal domain-containing protein n=1 Tax=Sphingopyxis macrogoltabida TaxID=33050 RepID=A0AAC9AUN3_SPHMC|nr:energy transducer TonB [Sphingopyxis macrogoltabida]ALJ13880.1 glycogen operon protein [Sphingopyxis macrogoltabida]AMU88682.1 hypothetical protein ATM17_06450 [Sphingopyxis macrogoltabida]
MKAIGIAAAILVIAVPTGAQITDQSAPSTKPPAQPHIIGSPMRWITNSDYPPAAVQERREGRVRFKLTINASGRVSNCEITASSGHADLDTQTCHILSRRARFVKATGSDEPRYFESIFSWNL